MASGTASAFATAIIAGMTAVDTHVGRTGATAAVKGSIAIPAILERAPPQMATAAVLARRILTRIGKVLALAPPAAAAHLENSVPNAGEAGQGSVSRSVCVESIFFL